MPNDDRRPLLTRRRFLLRAAAAGATLALAGTHGLAQAATAPTAAEGAPTLLDLGMEVAFTIELAAPTSGTYRRPYVVVWVEDPSGTPIRTVALWTDRAAPQYLHDLHRWIPTEMRRRNLYGVGNQLVLAISSPTRQPGRYQVVWDGLDDLGEPVPAGEYLLCVEAVRQSGPYALVRERLTLAAEPFEASFTPGPELPRVELAYRPRS
jgi:hypothetical protein